MGRVITGRGDVFNYKEGQNTALFRQLKPYDFEKVMRNAQRGMAVTKDIEKSSLLGSGSPIVQGVGAVAGLAKQGAEFAGRQLGLLDPAQQSERDKLEAVSSRAQAQGLLSKPPVAAPVPGQQGGAMVQQPDRIAPGRLERRAAFDPDATAPSPENIAERLAELTKLQQEALTPAMAQGYQAEIDELRSLSQGLRQPDAQRLSPQRAYGADQGFPDGTRAPIARSTPPQPQAMPPAAAPGMPQAAPSAGFGLDQARAIGPETAALYQNVEGQNALKQRAYAQAVQRAEAAQGPSTVGLTGQELFSNPAFNRRLREVASKLNADPLDLLRVFGVESGGRPNDPPPEGSSAAGLIQIINKRAEQLGTTSEAIRQMSPFKQLEFVEQYLSLFPQADYSKPMEADLAVFAPAALGKSDDFVLYQQGDGNYGPNAGVDLNSDGMITKGERRQWSQNLADKQGFTLPPDPGPPPSVPRPQNMNVRPEDLMRRRQLVDTGTLVIPNVRPQRVNFGSLSNMARNARSDAQKNWVRTLLIDNETDLPWRNLSDLFTGDYKRRAAKDIEAMFPELEAGIDPLTASKINLNEAKTRQANATAQKSRQPAAKPPKKPWTPYYEQIKRKTTDLQTQRQSLVKLRSDLQRPKFMAGEMRLPERGQMMSDAEHKDLVDWFKGIQGKIDASRDRSALIEQVNNKLLGLEVKEERLQKLNATANSFFSRNAQAVPASFVKDFRSYFDMDLGGPMPKIKVRPKASPQKQPTANSPAAPVANKKPLKTPVNLPAIPVRR